MSHVWYVMGDPDDTLFAEKIDSETHARVLFPNEDSDTRYARIFYKTVFVYQSRPTSEEKAALKTWAKSGYLAPAPRVEKRVLEEARTTVHRPPLDLL